MQKNRPISGKGFRHVLPFFTGAFVIATLVVACDRGGHDAGADDVATRAATTSERAAPPQAAQPAPASTMPPREALADTVITGKIKAAILTDPSMRGADISVNTDHGVVSLTGQVKTPEQTAVASAHAQRQDGVMRVDNHLTLALQ